MPTHKLSKTNFYNDAGDTVKASIDASGNLALATGNLSIGSSGVNEPSAMIDSNSDSSTSGLRVRRNASTVQYIEIGTYSDFMIKSVGINKHLYLENAASGTSNTYVKAISGVYLQTNGSTTALALDTAQGATFSGVATFQKGLKRITRATTTTSVTATDADYLISCDNAAGVTVNLPPVASSTGLVLVIKRVGATGTVTVDGNASETIDGATTYALTVQYQFVEIQCNGTTWRVIGKG